MSWIMDHLPERLRWWVAHKLQHSQRYCWALLCTWATGCREWWDVSPCNL
jgi:hypothetical protein